LSPLAKIASGGELSRIMLAIQALSSTEEHEKILIYDEVDTGIGGHTANTIGHFIKQVSQSHQVLCISHLPQIAKCADHHFYVSKNQNTTTTTVTIAPLTLSEKRKELNRMIGGHVFS